MIIGAGAGGVAVICKAPLRRHHLNRIANGKTGHRKAGKDTAINALDPDTNASIPGRGTDRIGAARLDAVNIGLQGQILARQKGIIICKVWRHSKSQRDREIIEPFDVTDCQTVETRRHCKYSLLSGWGLTGI